MVPNRFTVVLDANVLFGALHRNVALSLAEAGFFRPRWSGETISELRRNLPKRLPADVSKQQIDRILRAFPEGQIEVEPRLIAGLELPDPADRHVLAAAIQARAAQIVTENLKDFPLQILESFELEAVSPDQLFANTIALSPARAITCIKRMKDRLSSPSYTGPALLLLLERRGLPETASELSEYVTFLE